MAGITDALLERTRADRAAMLHRLVDRFAGIECVGVDRFATAPTAGAFDRIYGGQSLAEASIAAAKTVDSNRRLHSTHGYFLRLGDPGRQVSYIVDRLRDTRSFSVRQVRAEQDGHAMISFIFSFAAPTRGIEHQTPAPEAPPPETFPPRDAVLLA